MNTITGYGFLTSGLPTSNYRGRLASSATSANSLNSSSANVLQKMLGRLDSLDGALESFQSGKSRQRNSPAVELLAPATSARLTSIEAINPTTTGGSGANTINPSSAFDGSTGNSPNFESGLHVSAGSFKVNGIEIPVAADDNLYSVLSSINHSAADVTASYNAGEEKIVLTHNTLGAGTTIDLSDDNSGFLNATKLNDAELVPGTESVTRIDNTGARSRSYKTADLLEELDQSISTLLGPSTGQGLIYQSALQGALNTVIEDMYSNFGKARLKRAGLEFTGEADQFLTLNKTSRRRLVHGLQDGDSYLLNALTANDSNGKKGLIPALKEAILEHLGSGGSHYAKGALANYRV